MSLDRLGRNRPRRIPVGPLHIDRLTERELLTFLINRVRAGRGCVVTYAHLHTLSSANRSGRFATAINSCDLCYCDGIGVSYASLLLNRVWIPKVTANNFVRRLVDIAEGEQWRMALVGSRGEALAIASHEFIRRGAIVTYVHDGFFAPDASAILCDEVAKAAPDIVLVGMGQTRQEEFALALRSRLPKTVIYCVGGLFPFIAGREGRCPAWVRHFGFEWTFRLAADPIRLWRRYLADGPSLLARALIRRKL